MKRLTVEELGKVQSHWNFDEEALPKAMLDVIEDRLGPTTLEQC